jgi:HSP20 family protein
MPCDPLRDLRAWQERLERLSSIGGPHGAAWAPPIDVYETDDRYVITAEVPGLSRDQIELAVQDNRLTIRGERPAGVPESTTRHYHQVERGHGSFVRVFAFTEGVHHDAIAADLRDGVLTITLPKTVSPPRRIEVQ